MKRTLHLITMTLVALIVLDVCVAFTLTALKDRGRLGGLTNYFDLGRSVPTKLADWQKDPGQSANLFNVAWIDEILDRSKAGFASEPADRPVLRNYGMSFSNRLGQAAIGLNPSYSLDSHGGPAAPANHTYALFKADRKNRREGDVLMFGILSSSVPYITSMSNRSWAFEQPAPFTYPKYELVSDQLNAVQPQVFSVANEINLANSDSLAMAWKTQLSTEDFFYSDVAFAAPLLDASPFAKLVRRALVLRKLEDKKQQALSEEFYPIYDVMLAMISDFAQVAKADGQFPVVALIQSNGPNDVNLRDFLASDLEALGIPYIATEDFVDPKDPAKFIRDGHYVDSADMLFAEALWAVIGSK